MYKLLVINGPNLNRLGKREPHIYGSTTLEELEQRIKNVFNNQCIIEFYQSNHEGFIIDKIHDVEELYDGLVINPGALTHYSLSLRDAISSISKPTIEVHISNVHAREEFRHKSVIAPVVKGQIVGLGLKGYELAITSLLSVLGGEN
ncbi:MAG: 3-dehydroquinate dehydratase, type [Bacillales bacterium]|nr:3-dehydroquinate dehydratase, type [Bacillales bacterium]